MGVVSAVKGFNGKLAELYSPYKYKIHYKYKCKSKSKSKYKYKFKYKIHYKYKYQIQIQTQIQIEIQIQIQIQNTKGAKPTSSQLTRIQNTKYCYIERVRNGPDLKSNYGHGHGYSLGHGKVLLSCHGLAKKVFGIVHVKEMAQGPRWQNII